MSNATGQAPSVHSLDHFAIEVPDITEARRFYETFGLDVRDAGEDRLELYTFGNDHRWGVVTKGSRKRLRFISFGAYEADMAGLRERARAAGAAEIAAPEGESNGFWIASPDGVPIEIRVADKSSPDDKSGFSAETAAPGRAGTHLRSQAPVVRPRRLSHFAIFTPDVMRMIAFAQDALGLKLSDHSGDVVAFLHGTHGSDHHMLALVKSDGPGMHHISWDVGSVQDVGLGAAQMAAAGFDRGWGLGRHVLGANYFQYIRDPWGSYSEYSADMDYIPAGHDWKAGDHDPADSMFLWGPNPPPDFIENFESAKAG